MFGNLINNKQLIDLREGGDISITPFDQGLLKAVHYPLHVKSIYRRQPDGSWKRAHCFAEDSAACTLEANEYVVVEINELIVLKKGIIGQFLPASQIVEAGFSLTAGRLEFPFGARGESIRFGVRNELNMSNSMSQFYHLAHVHFFDIRGLSSNVIVITQQELEFFAQRISQGRRAHAADDGVIPLEDGYLISPGKR